MTLKEEPPSYPNPNTNTNTNPNPNPNPNQVGFADRRGDVLLPVMDPETEP